MSTCCCYIFFSEFFFDWNWNKIQRYTNRTKILAMIKLQATLNRVYEKVILKEFTLPALRVLSLNLALSYNYICIVKAVVVASFSFNLNLLCGILKVSKRQFTMPEIST